MSRARGALVAVLAGACEPASPAASECPAWTRAEGDRCVLRSWQVPGPDDAIGSPGARDVEVALGPDGDALIAWARVETTADGPVVLAEPVDGGWTTTEVRAGAGAGLEPAVALGPHGHALLAWKQQRVDGAIHVATRDDAGRWRWPEAEAPLSWPHTAYEPRVAFAPDGEAMVLWNQWTGEHFGVALARRAADEPTAAFVVPAEPAQLLSPAVNYSNAPQLATSEGSEVLVTWYQAPVDDLAVYASERREPDGALTHPTAEAFLSPPGGPVDSHAQANPWPALHGSGAAAIAWTQQRGEGDVPVYLATRDPDGTWHQPASLDDSLSRPGAFARCARVAFDPRPDDPPPLLVAWFQTRDDDTAVLAWRGVPGEPAPDPERLSAPGTEAVHPAVAFGPDGGAVVVWAEREPGHDDAWRVVARRHQPHADAWLPTEPISTPAIGLAPQPQIALAPDDGRVLVAWAEGGVLDGRVQAAWLP